MAGDSDRNDMSPTTATQSADCDCKNDNHGIAAAAANRLIAATIASRLQSRVSPFFETLGEYDDDDDYFRYWQLSIRRRFAVRVTAAQHERQSQFYNDIDDGSLVAHGALVLGRVALSAGQLYAVRHGYRHGHVRCVQKATTALDHRCFW
jgi:hypothetical protein